MDSTMGIPEFFSGKSVFITGGTGFMGKVLVEKLLRSCPEIDTIYLLMRPKRGQQVAARLIDMLNAKVFEWLRKNNKEVMNKVAAISGDITLPELGMSTEDQNIIIERVSVVFHSAATVKFDEPMKVAVPMNLTGTKRLLELCEKMNKLESVVHVSTAYSNCDHTGEIKEQLYPSPANPDSMMKVVEILDDHLLETLQPKLLGDKPNTYTFTKSLAEQVVYDQNGRLPLAIFRPSIVTAAVNEPLPGWVDNTNGPTGMIIGAGKGVLRTLLADRDCIADFIPVDYAINCLIAVAWYTAVHRKNCIEVYHCTSGSVNPIHWRVMETVAYKYMLQYPPRDLLWYPGGSLKTNRLAHHVHQFLAQTIPAHLIDSVARLLGKKPIMVRIQDKLKKSAQATQFFSMREFHFKNENVPALFDKLNKLDQSNFYFDVKQINWEKYLEQYVIGVRHFVLKEDPKNIAESRVNLRRMYLIHRFAQFLMIAFTVWGLVFKSSVARSMIYHMLSLIIRTTASFTRAVVNETQ